MTDQTSSAGVTIAGGATIGEDVIGRDKIVSNTNTNVYAGLTVGDMFRLRLVMSYERLWGLLEPLALYGRTAPFTVDAARQLSEQLRRWYFQEAGGMYLHFSPELAAHEQYIKLQKFLQQTVETLGDSAPPERVGAAFEAAQAQGHTLRQAMAREIQHYMLAGRASQSAAMAPSVVDPPAT